MRRDAVGGVVVGDRLVLRLRGISVSLLLLLLLVRGLQVSRSLIDRRGDVLGLLFLVDLLLELFSVELLSTVASKASRVKVCVVSS